MLPGPPPHDLRALGLLDGDTAMIATDAAKGNAHADAVMLVPVAR